MVETPRSYETLLRETLERLEELRGKWHARAEAFELIGEETLAKLVRQPIVEVYSVILEAREALKHDVGPING